MDENLIGYLLDAIEPPARQEVEAYLHSSPAAKARLETLKRALAPLAADAEIPEPPPGLVVSTLARIAEYRCPSLPPAPALRPAGRPFRRRPRWADLAAAAVLLILVGSLSTPWLLRQWHLSNRQTCENNLRTYWTAMQGFGDRNEGSFPQLTETGPRSLAGSFVPVLNEAGFLAADSLPACGPKKERTQQVATLEDLDNLLHHADRPEFGRQARALAGNYAYSLGYLEDGSLRGLRRDSGDDLPLMADHRPLESRTENSPNHGGQGQNVLYIGGNVRWCPGPAVGRDGDNIYFNRNQKVQAGVTRDDTVLGSGDATPMPN